MEFYAIYPIFVPHNSHAWISFYASRKSQLPTFFGLALRGFQWGAKLWCYVPFKALVHHEMALAGDGTKLVGNRYGVNARVLESGFVDLQRVERVFRRDRQST